MSSGGSVDRRARPRRRSTMRSSPTRAASDLLGPQVVVLQVHRARAGRRPTPGRGARGSRRSAGTWPPSRPGRPATSGRSRAPVEHLLPAASDLGADLLADRRSRPCVLGVLRGPVEQLPLHLERGDRASRRPARAAGAASGRRTTWRMRLHRRRRSVKSRGSAVVLDHRQHERRGADLQEGRDLGAGWRRRR